MEKSIEQILNQISPSTSEETKLALREIIQSIVLVGLSRGGFFKYASFYGGTALRIFYGLNRYSEDLDFTLNKANKTMCIDKFANQIKIVALSYGLDLDIVTKAKRIESPIESAFAKLNTYQTFIKLKIGKEMTETLHKDETIKVKLEIDCNPPLGFNVATKWIDIPEFAPVIVLDEPSLFAGKLHAILCRTYKSNVKGRDYYDFLFFISRKIKPNLTYLKNKLIESGKIRSNDAFDLTILKTMLKNRFETVDFEEVRKDASRFVFNKEDLTYYSKELFMQMADKI